MKRISAYLVLFLVCGIAAPAHAKDWVIDYPHSTLGFVGNQSGTLFNGGFKTFTMTVDLDPDKPETGKITAVIDIASITAGSSERDSYLPQPDWFDSGTFAQATFTSTAIRKTGGQAYVADGDLTIKGITKPIALPFTLTPEGDHWRAKGRVTLTRTDFHIGAQDWANEDYVKYAVDVVIDVAAKPAP